MRVIFFGGEGGGVRSWEFAADSHVYFSSLGKGSLVCRHWSVSNLRRQTQWLSKRANHYAATRAGDFLERSMVRNTDNGGVTSPTRKFSSL